MGFERLNYYHILIKAHILIRRGLFFLKSIHLQNL